MFEEESIKWATRELGNGYVDDIGNHSKTYRQGAEFGYNEAMNEIDLEYQLYKYRRNKKMTKEDIKNGVLDVLEDYYNIIYFLNKGMTLHLDKKVGGDFGDLKKIEELKESFREVDIA